MKITVAIPVGPFEANRRWLGECLESVAAQTIQPDEVVLIDDMAGLSAIDVTPVSDIARVWRSPWRAGVAHAFNFGVALARNEAVFMLGSDDTLAPECLERCAKAWEQSADPLRSYFWVGVHYLDDRGDQFLPCNAALVSRTLWRETGGFPVETAIGAPDAALVSIMMVHHDAGRLVEVPTRPRTLYNYRPHAETDTAGRGAWQGAILQARDILTAGWTRPEWRRTI